MKEAGKFIDAYSIAMPPKDSGLYLLDIQKYFRTNKKCKSGHFIDIELSFFIISRLDMYKSEHKYSFDNAYYICAEIACCNGDENQESHVQDIGICDDHHEFKCLELKEVMPLIHAKDWYWQLHQVQKWVNIDDIPTLEED